MIEDVAARLRAVQVQRGGGQHADHALAYYDPEDGVVCGCGEPLGVRIAEFDAITEPPDTGAEPEPLVVGGEVEPPDAQQESVLISTGRELVRREVNPIIAQVPLIDPSLPYGPKEVEEHIIDATSRLERGIEFEASLVAAAHAATMEYTLAYNRALAQQSGGDKEWRAARAMGQVENEYRTMMQAVIARDAMKATTHSLRSVLTAYQSLAKSVAATYGATNQVESAQRNGGYF